MPTIPDPSTTVAQKPVRIVDQLWDSTRSSHRVATRVEILYSAGVEGPWAIPISQYDMSEKTGTGPIVLDTLQEVLGGSVSLDAGAEVRGRFTLTVPAVDYLIPTRPDDLLAPFGNEVRISRGIEYDDRIDLVRLGIFRIDACRVSGNTITIEGLDRSATYIDAAFPTPGYCTNGEKIIDRILYTISSVGHTVAAVYDFMDNPMLLNAPKPLIWEEGEDRWAFCQGLAFVLGAELFFNRYGILVLRPIPRDTGKPVAEFSEGPNGVLLNADRAWDRTRITNKVTVTCENTADDTIFRGEAIDANPNSPTYHFGRFGPKPLWTTNSFCPSDESCRLAAEGVLARSMGAPDQIDFSAVPTPGLTPGDTVLVKRAKFGINETHVIDAVDIPLGASEAMSARTRAVELFGPDIGAAAGPADPPNIFEQIRNNLQQQQ